MITSPDHTAFIGARVGSNNTGELSAIAEALLYARENEIHEVVVKTDSRWSINVITGKWRPRTHHDLINKIRDLMHIPHFRVKLEWIKAHVGHEGNERADKLANEGRASHESTGGRLHNAPVLGTPAEHGNDAWATSMKSAAADTFYTFSRNPKKPWISSATLAALRTARVAEADSQENAKQLRNQAKRLARKDRIAWVHEQLREDPGGLTKKTWTTTRNQRKGFIGKKSHLVVDGKPVPWSQTHEAFRDHLATKQWAGHQTTPLVGQVRTDPLFTPDDDCSPFTMQDLQTALSKLKRNKAPGPDSVPNELFLLFDRDLEIELLAFYNKVLLNGIVPDDWKEATVVSIFKGKGADTEVENYRPISLLNTVYKIFAAMLQSRLATLSEAKLRQNQFGFRAGRGTRHPLFILRRSMEWAKMTNHSLHYLFLDWKQAFDSLDHTAMLTALDRFGIPPNYLSIITSLYTDPTFQVISRDGRVAKGKVGSGIRQGCPLSPYLFIIVLSVIMSDLDDHLLDIGVPTNTWSVGRPTYDLEYADDTLLMALTHEQMQQFLSGLEKIAASYGMQLNETKTEILSPPDHTASLYFSTGARVPRATKVKYLGSMISWDKPFETAFQHRLGVAETAFKKLRLVWNCNMPRSRKVKIFQATFLPCLIYGLDALTLTAKNLQAINAQYYRFLRRAIGIKASYYSRVSNDSVWEQAGRPQRASESLHAVQHKMLQEVFAHNMDHPLHNVVFATGFKDRILSQGRRRGMQFPYYIEVMQKRYYPDLSEHTATAEGPHFKYVRLSRILRDRPVVAPKRAARRRARP